MYLQHMLLKIRKTIWKFTLVKYHAIVFASFKHPKLPISIKIPVALLQIVYVCITAISPNLNSWTTSLLTWLYGTVENNEPGPDSIILYLMLHTIGLGLIPIFNKDKN